MRSYQYLDFADYLLIAEAVLGMPAERWAEMPRVVSMANSALAVPRAGWAGKDAYPEFAQKAALLAARLAKNHPLPDGNKRVAFLAMVEFIERNGGALLLKTGKAEEAVSALVAVASGEMPELEFVEWVQRRLDPYADMSDSDFEVVVSSGYTETSTCTDCSGSGDDADGSTCVYCSGDGRMIRISDVGVLNHMLVQHGVFHLSDLDLAGWVSLSNAFGNNWRQELDVPADVPPAKVWMAVLRTVAATPSEGEAAVDRWLHTV